MECVNKLQSDTIWFSWNAIPFCLLPVVDTISIADIKLERVLLLVLLVVVKPLRLDGEKMTGNILRPIFRGRIVPQTSAMLEFPCPHCEKTFREERSRESHIKSVHDPSNKRKRVEALPCLECQAMDIVRVFPHKQALQDHIRAKHTSLHSNIQPDWAKEKAESSLVNNKSTSDVDLEESGTTFGSVQNLWGSLPERRG